MAWNRRTLATQEQIIAINQEVAELLDSGYALRTQDLADIGEAHGLGGYNRVQKVSKDIRSDSFTEQTGVPVLHKIYKRKSIFTDKRLREEETDIERVRGEIDAEWSESAREAGEMRRLTNEQRSVGRERRFGW